jgi:hypothetical protein
MQLHQEHLRQLEQMRMQQFQAAVGHFHPQGQPRDGAAAWVRDCGEFGGATEFSKPDMRSFVPKLAARGVLSDSRSYSGCVFSTLEDKKG